MATSESSSGWQMVFKTLAFCRIRFSWDSMAVSSKSMLQKSLLIRYAMDCTLERSEVYSCARVELSPISELTVKLGW